MVSYVSANRAPQVRGMPGFLLVNPLPHRARPLRHECECIVVSLTYTTVGVYASLWIQGTLKTGRWPVAEAWLVTSDDLASGGW